MSTNEPRWRKSTRSTAQGNCIEVADNIPGTVLVRDSKDHTGLVLTFGPGAWAAFVKMTRATA